jgi:hypothetical protein
MHLAEVVRWKKGKSPTAPDGLTIKPLADLPPLKWPSDFIAWPLKRRGEMPKKRHSAEQIIGKLREVEVLVGRGSTLGDAVRSIGVTDQTYYRWRKEYGGLKMDQAKRLKELERENPPECPLLPGSTAECGRSRPCARQIPAIGWRHSASTELHVRAQ